MTQDGKDILHVYDRVGWKALHYEYHCPPRSARTRCNTAPAVMLKSFAVFSSGLLHVKSQGPQGMIVCEHTFVVLRRSVSAAVGVRQTAPRPFL
jgi:hypothetical protein